MVSLATPNQRAGETRKAPSRSQVERGPPLCGCGLDGPAKEDDRCWPLGQALTPGRCIYLKVGASMDLVLLGGFEPPPPRMWALPG
jgi:hypothetical protein